MAAQPVRDEGVCRDIGKRAGKVEHDHRIGPGLSQITLPLVERGQAERRCIGRKMADGVRIECGDKGRRAARAGQLHGPTDDGLMPGMDTVKIAKRDDAASKGVCYRGIAIKSFHRGGL
jgi:hypothetical protein